MGENLKLVSDLALILISAGVVTIVFINNPQLVDSDFISYAANFYSITESHV